MSPISSALSTAPPSPAGAPVPDDPESAARQFESVLVRQFVEVMTKDLFQGEEGMMTGQADLQRDTLTDTLAEHLVESGTFGIADLLLAQWDRQGRIDAPTEPAAPRPGRSESRPSDEQSPRRVLHMDDALRLYPSAQAPPAPIDHPYEDLP